MIQDSFNDVWEGGVLVGKRGHHIAFKIPFTKKVFQIGFWTYDIPNLFDILAEPNPAQELYSNRIIITITGGGGGAGFSTGVTGKKMVRRNGGRKPKS
jgi:hypothetical protein